MKTKSLLLAAMLFAGTATLPHLVAQNAPSTTPDNPAHDAIDQNLQNFIDAFSALNPKKLPVGFVNDSTDGYMYLPGAGAQCDSRSNGLTITLKAGELLLFSIYSSSTLQPSLMNASNSPSNTGGISLALLENSVQLSSSQAWTKYGDEGPLDTSSTPDSSSNTYTYFFVYQAAQQPGTTMLSVSAPIYNINSDGTLSDTAIQKTVSVTVNVTQ